MKHRPLHILLVEDEETDVFLAQLAMAKAGSAHSLHAAHDAGEAIRYLRGEGNYADRQNFPLPDLILTDLKLPGMNGLDFLRWLRSQPESSSTPTIVFSNSSLEKDTQQAYHLGANSYILKPTALDELADILHALSEYWSRCELPSATSVPQTMQSPA